MLQPGRMMDRPRRDRAPRVESGPQRIEADHHRRRRVRRDCPVILRADLADASCLQFRQAFGIRIVFQGRERDDKLAVHLDEIGPIADLWRVGFLWVVCFGHCKLPRRVKL